MAYEYRPGMKMYEAIWERDGKRVGVWCMHAENEADVLSEAQAFFAEHPEHEFPGGRDGTTVRVGIVGGDGSVFANFKDMPKSKVPRAARNTLPSHAEGSPTWPDMVS